MPNKYLEMPGMVYEFVIQILWQYVLLLCKKSSGNQVKIVHLAWQLIMSCHGQDHFVYAPRQYCNIISHWLDAFTKWSLHGTCAKLWPYFIIKTDSRRISLCNLISGLTTCLWRVPGSWAPSDMILITFAQILPIRVRNVSCGTFYFFICVTCGTTVNLLQICL